MLSVCHQALAAVAISVADFVEILRVLSLWLVTSVSSLQIGTQYNEAMPNVATSVRITSDAINSLDLLSTKLGKSKAQVVEVALKQLEERVFWDEVRDAFARTASNPEEAAVQKAEFTVWDRASNKDLSGEEKW